MPLDGAKKFKNYRNWMQTATSVLLWRNSSSG